MQNDIEEFSQTITLAHGEGGRTTRELIEHVFFSKFYNPLLAEGEDAAIFLAGEKKFAFTTDSFVVHPLFFAGGDIGKLAVCGTMNDLVVSGAKPLFLSAGFIIEEGFKVEQLEKIVASMEEVCAKFGVSIVTGDTKVVEKGKLDKIYVNTSGIGVVQNNYERKSIQAGDQILITGGIGEHGTTIAMERFSLTSRTKLKSDCASLIPFLQVLKPFYPFIKQMRDPTRGGLATTLQEFVQGKKLGAYLLEEEIPILDSVKAVNSLLGLDPLYMACEGRIVLVVESTKAKEILAILKEVEEGNHAAIIGEIKKDPLEQVIVENYFGGKRIVPFLEGSMLPRIC